MKPETKQKLEEAGWAVECESPLEIRHEDGSFASLNAAEMVIDYLRQQETEHKAFGALNTIKGCAALAKQSCDGQMQKLWEAGEGECRKAVTVPA